MNKRDWSDWILVGGGVFMVLMTLLLMGLLIAAIHSSAKDAAHPTAEAVITKDGCTMYRLNDGGAPVYWTKCAGAVPSTTTSIYYTPVLIGKQIYMQPHTRTVITNGP